MRVMSLIFSVVLIFAAFLYLGIVGSQVPVNTDDMLRAIQISEDGNMDAADSAPQQTVAMLWTLRDYSTAIMKQNAITNSFLGFLAGSMALLLAFTGFSGLRSSWGRRDCEYCHESVKKDADICPFCKTEFHY